MYVCVQAYTNQKGMNKQKIQQGKKRNEKIIYRIRTSAEHHMKVSQINRRDGTEEGLIILKPTGTTPIKNIYAKPSKNMEIVETQQI